jgi:8-oxo-dGTP pyrophosphatase MutT (NUDIX family)
MTHDPAKRKDRTVDGSRRATAVRLAERMSGPLPGLEAQKAMAPFGRISGRYTATPAGASHAAVLLLVTARSELVFIRRAADGRAHSGEIAFPGGAREAVDADLAATAVRETEEEIGVPRAAVTVLGELTPLYIPVSNFSVHPFVGCADDVLRFVCQPSEVDEAILLPIPEFAAARDELEIRRRGFVYRAPCYRFGEVTIWGATAMITAEFLQVWREATRELSHRHDSI